MFERFTASIQTFAPFSQEQAAVVIQCLQTLHIKKDECVIKEGQVSRTFYFIDEGCFRHYGVRENGEEATLNLYITGEWMFEYASFVKQQPSRHIIQAVSDSRVFGLGIHDFHDLVKRSDSFFRLGRIFEQAIQNQDFQRLSPEQKYERLLASKPELLHHFPLKYIASYLEMTPETLSRVRKRIIS
jgi:CRP-like cAMP-binding protein